MKFTMPEYKAPDFTRPELASAPDCRLDRIFPGSFFSDLIFSENGIAVADRVFFFLR